MGLLSVEYKVIPNLMLGECHRISHRPKDAEQAKSADAFDKTQALETPLFKDIITRKIRVWGGVLSLCNRNSEARASLARGYSGAIEALAG